VAGEGSSTIAPVNFVPTSTTSSAPPVALRAGNVSAIDSVTAPSPGMPVLRYADTWDANLEVGGGYGFGDARRAAFVGRVRAGALFVRGSSFLQAGATVEWAGLGPHPAFGLQFEYMHLESGGWLQIGGALDAGGHPGGMFAIGLSVVGVEAEARRIEGYAGLTPAIFAKLRLPLGVIAYAIGRRGR
jgi:hypothetical protein